MILANEQVAGYLADRRLPTLYRVHERPDPPAVEFLCEQLASLDVPTPPLPEHMTPQQAADAGRRGVAHRGARGAAAARALGRARAALAQAGLLLAEEPRPRRARQPALLPLHLADPALPGRGGAPGAAPGARHRPDRHARRTSCDEVGRPASATEREAMKIERGADDVCLAFLLERTLAERRDVADVRGRGGGPDREGRLRALRRRGLRGPPARAPAARLVDAERAGHGARARGLGPRAAPGRPGRGGGRPGRDRRAAGSTCRPPMHTRRSDGQEAQAQGRAPATWPPTARPASATTCSSGTRPASCSRARRSSRCATASVQLKDAYAEVSDGEVWLRNMHIAPYEPARENHDPERPRKLLLHKREIERLIGKTAEKGLTIVPTRIYFTGRGPRSSSRWPAARTCTTSAARSRSATSSARSTGRCRSASQSAADLAGVRALSPRLPQPSRGRRPSASARGGWTAGACAAPTRRAPRPSSARCPAAARSPCTCSRARCAGAPRARAA